MSEVIAEGPSREFAVGRLLIGQQFDGTVVPLVSGFAAVSVGALVTVVITERGRLLAGPED